MTHHTTPPPSHALRYLPPIRARVRLWRGAVVPTVWRRLRPGQLAELRFRFEWCRRMNARFNRHRQTK